jgi:hypothetical protein
MALRSIRFFALLVFDSSVGASRQFPHFLPLRLDENAARVEPISFERGPHHDLSVQSFVGQIHRSPWFRIRLFVLQ